MARALVIALILLASVHLAAAQQGGLPAGLTRDLSRTAVAVPEGMPDGCPLGCDPVVNVTDGSLLIRVPAGEFIIFPDFAKTVNPWWFDSPMASFEMATGFWLLFKGLRPSGIAEPDKASG